VKQLIFDSISRWRWAFLLCFIIQVCIDAKEISESQYVILPIVASLPALLLAADLGRGTARVIGTLPMTLSQASRALWTTCVPLCTIWVIVAEWCGIVLCQFLKPAVSVAPTQLLASALAAASYSGTLFFVLTCLPTAPQKNLWSQIRAGLAGIAWGFGTCGMIALQIQFRTISPPFFLGSCIFGLILTAIGYARATTMLRARIRSSDSDARKVRHNQARNKAALLRQPALCGLPLILASSILHAFGLAAVFTVSYVAIYSFLLQPNGLHGPPQVSKLFSPGTNLFLLYAAILAQARMAGLQTSTRELRLLPLTALQLNLFLVGGSLATSLCFWIIPLLDYTFSGGEQVTDLYKWFVLLSGFLCIVNALILRWNMKALLVSKVFFPVFCTSVIGVVYPSVRHFFSWPISILGSLFFLGVAAALNQYFLTRSSAVYLPKKTFGGLASYAGR
jgi:hypothetical protein